ncbi:MAG: hypothetical protein VCB25_02185 [Myxococcota bacterium]
MRAAILSALAIPSTYDRISRLAKLGKALDVDNAEGMGSAIEEVVSSTAAIEIELLMGRWAEISPEAAFHSVMRWKLESKRKIGMNVVAYEWARLGSGVEGRTFIESLGQDRVKGFAVRGLVRGWAQSDDLSGLTDFVISSDKIGAREKLTEILVNSLIATNGIDAVMAWVDSVEMDAGNGYKRTAYKRSLRQVANRNPRMAADWYESQKDEGYTRRSVLVIGGEWVEHDPEEGLAWILEQPDDLSRRIALQRWVSRWASYDSAGIEKWMKSTDFGQEGLADLPENYVATFLPAFAEQAAPWVDYIPDEDARRAVVQAVAKAWNVMDFTGRSAFLAKHGETEELLKSLRIGRHSRNRKKNSPTKPVEVDEAGVENERGSS